ncbi:MAG: hypothetical protein AB1757_24425 [Acidobacteriota bacterium]
MVNRVSMMMILVLFGCVAGFGQSSYKGLTPGKSTKTDVERVLGQAARQISDTLSEYQSTNASEKIFVQYNGETSVVERIEAIYPATRDRADVLQALRLPARPTASQTNSKGKLEEYFATAHIVLTYASGETSDGVSRVGYYSRDLFASAIANVPRRSPDSRVDSPVAGTGEPRESAPRGNRPKSSATNTSTQTIDVAAESEATDSASKVSVKRIPDSSKEQAADVTTDSATSDRRSALSGGMVEQLAGRYEFEAQDEPLLMNVVVDGVDGKLRWNAGSLKYFLRQTGSGQISDAAGNVEKNIVHFKFEGKPDVSVQFILRGTRVEEVTYFEEKAGKSIFAQGKPKR